MRHIRIFLLQFNEVIEDKGRILVWFLLTAISPLLLILFWRGASQIPGWTSAEITTYYLLAIVVYAGVMTHSEQHVATIDIQEGGLGAYLLKPYSYMRLIFDNEVSYRLFQGTLACVMLGCLVFLFPSFFTFAKDVNIILISLLMVVFAFFLTFVFKMAVALFAFWLTETRGIFESVDVLIVIFSGVLMPIAFMPQWLQSVASFLPFSYMIYYPVIALEGKLSMAECLNVLLMQLIWIGLFYLLYKLLWKYGLRRFSAVGQ